MTKQNKIDLLTRLVKEGHITLCEAFELSEPSTEEKLQNFMKNWQDVPLRRSEWLEINPSKPNPYKHTPTTISFNLR